MTMFSFHDPWLFTFGILGNFVSFLVYLAPMTTFYRVIKKKSTEGFHCVPYMAALFSSMLWIYYAYLKSNATLIITINSVGCVIETIYISIYVAYAPKKARIQTVKLLVLLNFASFWLILALTRFLASGSGRIRLLGWICMVFSVIVFAAPLSIVAQVIKTKSVEFMPFSLSFFLALSAVMWFFYGLLLKDIYIAVPNVLGFTFGVLQMALYLIYKKHKVEEEIKTLPTTVKPALKNAEVHPLDGSQPNANENKPLQEEDDHNQNENHHPTEPEQDKNHKDHCQTDPKETEHADAFNQV